MKSDDQARLETCIAKKLILMELRKGSIGPAKFAEIYSMNFIDVIRAFTELIDDGKITADVTWLPAPNVTWLPAPTVDKVEEPIPLTPR